MEHGAPVLVTGGASGLGAAVVERLAGEGPVVVLDRRAPAERDDGSVMWLQVDLADGRATETAVARAAELGGGRLRALVTCAGTDACGPLEQVDALAWEQVVAVNLLATAACVRAALPALEAGAGRIVTVASTLGWCALPDATAYCASKVGVVGFTRALAAEIGTRVPVTLLLPGGMDTAFFGGRPKQYQPEDRSLLGDPRQVAEVIAFVLAQPRGLSIREVLVCPDRETSWP